MAEPVLGSRVRVEQPDLAAHLRIPRYCRGATGVVVADHGLHPPPRPARDGWRDVVAQPLLGVRFGATALWGEGVDHHVEVDLFASALVLVPPDDDPTA